MEDLLEKYRNNNAFQVPEGYFDELPDQVMRRISESSDEIQDDFPLESRVESDFPVPAGYFDSLHEQVMSRIAAGEADKMAAPFVAANGESDFPVPAGYFDELPNQVLSRIKADETRKLFLRRRIVKITSVAASVCLLLGVGAFVALHRDSVVPNQKSGIAKVILQKSKPTSRKTVVEGNTLDMEKALACNTFDNVPVPAGKSSNRVNPTTDTDAHTDKFISDNLMGEELDEVDYDILDFYTDDVASYDVWGY